MSHVAHRNARVSPPRSRSASAAPPRPRSEAARRASLAAPLTLAAIVICTPLMAAAVALAGALGA